MASYVKTDDRRGLKKAIIAAIGVAVIFSCEASRGKEVYAQGPTAAVLSIRLPMADGVKLATNVYLPSGTPPWPVVLVRYVYLSDSFDSMASSLNELGIALVVQ